MSKSMTFAFNTFEQMTYDETLLYYDEPLIFTLRDRAQNRYLAYMVDRSESDEITYYISPCSDYCYQQLTSGKLSLREAIARPRVYIWYTGNTIKPGRWIEGSTLDEETLPDPGVPLVDPIDT